MVVNCAFTVNVEMLAKTCILKALKKFSEEKLGTGLYWYCPSCNAGVTKILVEIKGLKDNHLKMNKELEELKKKVDTIQISNDKLKEINQLRQEVDALNKGMEELKKKCVDIIEIEEVKREVEKIRIEGEGLNTL